MSGPCSLVSCDVSLTWVSLEDGRAYASWAGKRLARELEWQLAAQGRSGRIYPWENSWDDFVGPAIAHRCIVTAADDVDAHLKSVSELGVMDLVGNVQQ